MNCVKSSNKKYKTRHSPPYPANQCQEGLVKIGNDGNKWIIKKTAKGVNRWVKYIGSQQTDISKLTIPKLKQKLDKAGIKYKKSAKKSVLLALLNYSNHPKNHPI